MPLPAAAPIAPHATFRVRLRSGVWAVTKDDAFFGDYLTRGHAIEGARTAASRADPLGGETRVVVEGADQASLATRMNARLRSGLAALIS